MRLFEHDDRKEKPHASIFDATEAYYAERSDDLCERAGMDPNELANRLAAAAHATARIRIYRDLDLTASSIRRDGK